MTQQLVKSKCYSSPSSFHATRRPSRPPVLNFLNSEDSFIFLDQRSKVHAHFFCDQGTNFPKYRQKYSFEVDLPSGLGSLFRGNTSLINAPVGSKLEGVGFAFPLHALEARTHDKSPFAWVGNDVEKNEEFHRCHCWMETLTWKSSAGSQHRYQS